MNLEPCISFGRKWAISVSRPAVFLLALIVAHTGFTQTIVIGSRNAIGTTPCPTYCEISGNWNNSSCSALVFGSRTCNQSGASFSVTPTLDASTGIYTVSITHCASTSISSNIIVSLSATGAAGLPATTTAFQRAKSVSYWQDIGNIVLDGSTSSPTITFTQSGGQMGAQNQFVADSFRFTKVIFPAPTLLYQCTGTTLTMLWTGGCTLQTSTNLMNGFADVAGPVTNGIYSEDISTAAGKFFRLRTSN